LGRHALSILLDQPPETEVAADLPAALLGRHPDLHADEFRLRGSLANVDATKAGFNPAFTLTGSAGTSSDMLVKVFQNPVAALRWARGSPCHSSSGIRRK
jgi:outer membrane protein TolC